MDYHGDYQHKSQYDEAKLLRSPWKTHFPALNNSKIAYLDATATPPVLTILAAGVLTDQDLLATGRFTS